MSFPDFARNSPYYTYIEAAYSQGVVTGYTDGTFSPYENITRGQVAKIVVQAAGLHVINPERPSFTDVRAMR